MMNGHKLFCETNPNPPVALIRADGAGERPAARTKKAASADNADCRGKGS
jgi:hypothetical protein